MGFVQTFFPERIGDFSFGEVLPWYVWDTVVVMQFAFVPFVLLFEGKMNKNVIKGYLPYYFYTFTWFPIAIVGIFKKNNKEWFHTQHTRTISIGEMKK